MALAACSTQSDGPSPTAIPATTTVPPSTTVTVTADVATVLYRECLADEGVDIEPIPFDAQGRPRLDLVMGSVDYSDPDSVAALTTCSGHLATGALDLSGSPSIREGVLSLLTEFSECVRARGVPDFPDPIPGFIGIGDPYPEGEIPFSDPDLEDAVEVCQSRLAGKSG